MDKILDKHQQDFNEVRRLCLLCHGLDLTSSSLFTGSTYEKPSEQTRNVLRGMISSSLLNLAIAIRINIYQGNFKECKIILNTLTAGWYYDEDLKVKPASVKDVCDKIIHADGVSKSIFPPGLIEMDVKLTIQFKGSHNGKAWTLNLCLEEFTESVLQLLDNIELKTDKEIAEVQ